MGCKWCTSGLGRRCHGPLGLDDLEAGCDCTCHECSECGNTHCENVGGDEPCDDGHEDYDDDYELDRPASTQPDAGAEGGKANG